MKAKRKNRAVSISGTMSNGQRGTSVDGFPEVHAIFLFPSCALLKGDAEHVIRRVLECMIDFLQGVFLRCGS